MTKPVHFVLHCSHTRNIQGCDPVVIDGWSVTAQYRKCGKPGCKVCSEGRGHGPYYYGTRNVDGKKEIHYFGRKLPETTLQAVQPSIQGHGSTPPPLALDDHIHGILDVVGIGAVVPMTRVRGDILFNMPIPEHTRMLHIVKETRTQQTTRAVDKATYMVPATYLVTRGSAVMHLHDVQFVDFYYHQYQAEIRMDVHTATGNTSFLLRGIDVVKLAEWLKEHARPPKRTVQEAEHTRDIQPVEDGPELTENQRDVLEALRKECSHPDRWATALMVGHAMGYPNDQASSRTLPVLRRLVELGYVEQIDRTKFRPV